LGLAGFRRGGGSDLVGPAFAMVGVLGFAFKAILIKLAYASTSIDAVTLLTLRMAYSAPFFALMAWWSTRAPNAKPLARRDWLSIVWLGFIGYYLSSLVDFIGLQYVTAALERLMLYLYPTIVVVLSAIFFKQRITGRIVVALVLSYVGILLVFARDLELAGDPGALWLGAALVFASSFLYACYLVGVGPVIARLGSLRFIALAMLTSALFIFAHFLATRPVTALLVPVRIHLLSLTMAVFSTVLPTYLIGKRSSASAPAARRCSGRWGRCLRSGWGRGCSMSRCTRSSWSARHWFSRVWRWLPCARQEPSR